jgi:hypothetical protein
VRLDVRQCKELRPELAGEHRVLVAHNGVRNPVEPDNCVEECPGDRCGHIWMSQCDEVGGFQKPVDDSQNDRLPVDVGESFDEVHRDIHPNHRRYAQWLQEASGMQLLVLVPLTGCLADYVGCPTVTSQEAFYCSYA